MPRRNKNARGVDRPRRIKVKINAPKVVFLPLHRQKDDISPGILVAVAEWRGGEVNEYSISRSVI